MRVFLTLAVINVLVLPCVRAQHGVDPFHGSNCTCDTFCNDQCAINATKPANVTLYRMTMLGVYGITSKNTADVPGDTSFIISRRTQAYECLKNPSSFLCKDVAQFDGDSPNNTDRVLQLTVEVDGEWGPYLPCNPVNVSDDYGPWHCSEDLGPTPASLGAQCKNFTVFSDYCWVGLFPTKKPVDSVNECCGLATASNFTKWSYDNDTSTCELFKETLTAKPCKGGYLGTVSVGGCNCTRVHTAVGKENLATAFGSHGSSSYPAGGEWYSHPKLGECKDGHYVGDGSGCTWRLVGQTASINASCLYNVVDDCIEANDQSCFSGCAQPKNRTSTCYLECYSKSVRTMDKQALTVPWTKAFASADPSQGGCPRNTN